MTNEIEIGVSTRLEGRENLKILFGKNNKVDRVQLNVSPINPFETFIKGRYCEHIPRITTRMYGINAVPHHLTPIKALETIWDVDIPESALKLRKLMINAAQFSSHILHFYAIGLPNFLKGPFLDPAISNINIINKRVPEYANMALNLIDFGRELYNTIGGKFIMPVSAIIGGIKKPLDQNTRKYFLRRVDKYIEFTEKTLDLCINSLEKYKDVINNVGNVPTYHIGLSQNGIHDIYEGKLRIVSPKGQKIDINIHEFFDFFKANDSNTSGPMHLYYKPAGYPDGIFQSNSLSRINTSDKMATDLANKALKEFKKIMGEVSNHVYVYPWVRIIEAIESIEIIKDLLNDSIIESNDCKTLKIEPKEGIGTGACETPTGLLLYRIWSDNDGICNKLEILTPTTLNIASSEIILTNVAKKFYDDSIFEYLKFKNEWEN